MGWTVGNDEGYAVRRDGVLLLRTASDTRHQAICNGLVLLFDADIAATNNTSPEILDQIWDHLEEVHSNSLKIVRCRAIEIE